MKGKKMRHLFTLIIIAGGIMCAQAANVVVVNPEKPGDFSEGEISVMLDAVGRELEKTGTFTNIPYQKMQTVFKEKNLNRVGICPDKSCLREAGKALSADYLVSLTLAQKGQPFDIKLVMFDVETGKGIAEAGAVFNGPKSQIVLKFLPAQTKELARMARPYAVKKDKEKSAVKEPKAAEPAAPAAKAQVPASAAVRAVAEENPSSQPRPHRAVPARPATAMPKKNILKSPAFWIPVTLVAAVPIAVAVYIRNSADDDGGGDELTAPYPNRPAVTRPEISWSNTE